MTKKLRTAGWFLCSAAGLMFASACAASGPADRPSTEPTATLNAAASCGFEIPVGTPAPEPSPPPADEQPTGAVIYWRPSMNSGDHCVRTTADAADAERIADAIRTAAKLSSGSTGSGPINCPADSGTEITAYLTYPSSTQDVVYGLSGCRGAGSSLRTDDFDTKPLEQVLLALAPDGYRHWIYP